MNVRTRHQELILGGPSAQQLFIRGPNAREALAIAAQEAQNVQDAQEANAQPANSTDESKTDDLVPGEADASNSNRDIVSTSTSSRIVIEASPSNQADIDAGASSQVVIEASILQRPSTAISRTEVISNRATIKASSSASAASTSSTDITEASSSNQVVITASTSKQAVVDAPSTSKEMSVNAAASDACENEPEAGPSQPKRIQPTIGEVVPPAVENPPVEGPSRSNDFGQQLIVVHQRLPHEDESGAQVSGHIELHVNPNLQDICDQSLSTMNRSHISDRCLCSFGKANRFLFRRTNFVVIFVVESSEFELFVSIKSKVCHDGTSKMASFGSEPKCVRSTHCSSASPFATIDPSPTSRYAIWCSAHRTYSIWM